MYVMHSLDKFKESISISEVEILPLSKMGDPPDLSLEKEYYLVINQALSKEGTPIPYRDKQYIAFKIEAGTGADLYHEYRENLKKIDQFMEMLRALLKNPKMKKESQNLEKYKLIDNTLQKMISRNLRIAALCEKISNNPNYAAEEIKKAKESDLTADQLERAREKVKLNVKQFQATFSLATQEQERSNELGSELQKMRSQFPPSKQVIFGRKQPKKPTGHKPTSPKP